MVTIDRPNNVTDNARRAYAEWHNCPTVLAVRIFWPYGVATHVVAFAIERNLMDEVGKAGMARTEHVLGFLEGRLLAEHQAEHGCLFDGESNIGLSQGDDTLQRTLALLGHDGHGAVL